MSPGLPCPALALGLLLLLLPGTRSDCGPPPKLNHAVPSDVNRTEGFPVDTQVTYRCSDGFLKIPGKSDTVVCLSNSQWSYINEFCGRKSCGHPGELLHGRAGHMTEFLFGAKIDLLCEDGYKLIGRPFIQCELKGDEVEWSKLPTCQDVTVGSGLLELLPFIVQQKIKQVESGVDLLLNAMRDLCYPEEQEHGRTAAITDFQFGARVDFIREEERVSGCGE
ncbi:unnamed protein product [Caretta caretta]